MVTVLCRSLTTRSITNCCNCGQSHFAVHGNTNREKPLPEQLSGEKRSENRQEMEYFCNKTPVRHGLTGAKVGKVAEIRGFISHRG
jgi:hypothetical protein